RFPFVVQAPAGGGGAAARVDPAAFEAWWNPAEVTIQRADATSPLFSLADLRTSLVPWLLALACLVYALEMFFVHYLCPRANPALTEKDAARRIASRSGVESGRRSTVKPASV